MPKPSGPHIKTTYKPNGTMTQEPVGFPGKQCLKATQPYAEKQGQHTTQPTDEMYIDPDDGAEREQEREVQ